MKDIETILSRHFLFSQLSPEERMRLGELATLRSYKKNECIFMKGEPGASIMAVASGCVRICAYTIEGREFVLNIIGPGEIFGEIACLDGGNRTADAFAMEDASLVVVSRRDFMPFLDDNPRVTAKLLKVLCHRIRWTADQFEQYTFFDLSARLAKKLLHLADGFGSDTSAGNRINLNLSQDMLASMVGATREAVNRQLSEWGNAGIVETRRGTVTLLNEPALIRLADPKASCSAAA